MEKTWELQRHPETGHVGGVCSGLALRWGVNPLLIRAVVIVLALSEGFGLVLYLGACAILPSSQKNTSWLEEKFPNLAKIPRSTQIAGFFLAAFLISTAASKSLLRTYWQLIVIGVLIWYGKRHTYRRQEYSRTIEAHNTAATFSYHAYSWQERVAQVKATSTTPSLADDSFWSHPDPAGIYTEERTTKIATITPANSYPSGNPLLISLRIILWLATLAFLFIFYLNTVNSSNWSTNLWLLIIPITFIFCAHLCSKGIRRGKHSQPLS